MSHLRRALLVASTAAACGGVLVVAGDPSSKTEARPHSASPPQPPEGFPAFTQTPRHPDNLLVFGCIHGDECAARGLQPSTNGCPDPASDVYLVPNLNPDGFALGTRLNGRGVDLNRNFPAGWKPIGDRGDPQYSGPRPFSEPETRLAARIVNRLRPEVTIWFHQHYARRPLVRAWGQSIAAARRYARLARLPFRRLPWLAGTAPNWQNHRFPGTASFVVETPRGPLPRRLESRLQRSIVLLAREVGKD